MIAEQILRQLKEFGYQLVIQDGNPALVPTVKDPVLPKGFVEQVKRQKAKLLALCICDHCERVTTNLEDMDVLKTNLYLCPWKQCQYKKES